MKILSILICSLITILPLPIKAQISDEYLQEISNKLVNMDESFDGRYPEYTVEGVYKYRDKVNWLSGFLGGELWNLYSLTKNDELKTRAIAQSEALLEYASIDYTHDMGFIFLPTAVQAYKQTGITKYKEAGIKAARMLVKRFNTKGNFIRAWGALSDSSKTQGWMIIDTMMNLDLLFWAWQETGNVEFYDVAYKHAITCMEESLRDDFTSYHIVEFNPLSGKVLKKRTHQGWKDESTWARGQAWGIYGFANAYKYTKDKRFLITSQKMADVFINSLPKDYVPYWDLDLVGEGVSRDASAAAIAASGMYILSDQVKLKEEYKKYINYANLISKSLIDNYTFLNSNRKNEEGLLIHTVYNFHKNWGVDESYTCGDFYFTEALRKYIEHNKLILNSSEEPRTKILINDTWFYLQDNPEKISDLKYSKEKWEKINIPHSWNKFDPEDSEPGYRRSASWYEKDIHIDMIDPSKLYKLYFEGVNISCDVYINNKKIGGHVGGYVGFEIDITNSLKKGSNKLLIRVDNSINKEIIPSQVSDFFIYGGISRDVWLKILPKINISKIKITTPEVTKNIAKTDLNLIIESNRNSKIKIKYTLLNPDGKVEIIDEKEELLKQGKNIIDNHLEELKNPILWSTSDPNLYRVLVTLISDGKILDEYSDRFGYRWFEFKPHGAFYLNGERLLLRGTHRHEELAGLANALSNEQHRNDIEMIKQMGANFIRLAHYPQDPEVYKACDELGILVWDELPWCRGGVGNREWKRNTVRLFEEQINQNINHPSIILWSVGNEVYWLPEFENGGNIDSLRAFTKILVDKAHKLDPTRLTSIRKFYEGADIVDVFSPSIWAGWYSGTYKTYDKALSTSQEKYPYFFHAEYGGGSHLGRHEENVVDGDGQINPDRWSEDVNQVNVKNIANVGDWSENYIVDLFDWYLKISETNSLLTGNAQWAFKDFATPLRPENPIPYINQKGLVDRSGIKKDAYYVFKSYWNKSDNFVYIESHTWDERIGLANQKREICIYSNCSKVEFKLNGKSLGVKKKDINKFPASGLRWYINFKSGKNILEAIGYDGNNSIATDKMEVNYSYVKNGKPEGFKMFAERMSNGNYLVTAIAVDENSRRCLDYNERVYFSAEGSGNLIENYGNSTNSSIIEMANGKAQIEFKPIPFEKTTIEVRNQNMKGNYLVIDGVNVSHD